RWTRFEKHATPVRPHSRPPGTHGSNPSPAHATCRQGFSRVAYERSSSPARPVALCRLAWLGVVAGPLSVEDAIALAAQAHRGQRCFTPEAEPYIFHPLRVMLSFLDAPVDQMAA